MSSMINKDKLDEFEKSRDELEYLASFINYEAVQKTRDLRTGENMITKTSDEDFSKLLDGMSDIDIPEFNRGQ